MRIIALMVLRNEDWILGTSLRAVTKWCDGAAIFLDRCTDSTVDIVREVSKANPRFDMIVGESEEGEHWNEMHHRQRNLEDGRQLDASHFAIVDADEILTHNNLDQVRSWFETLKDGEVLDAPMVAPWKSLDYYSPNTRGVITLGFKDMPGLGWAPRGEEQYHHHNRPPHGMTARVNAPVEAGGVFHLQFAAWDRFLWKHRHYMMSELIRWPYSPAEINDKYHWWNRPPHGMELTPVPKEWWGDYRKSEIRLKAMARYERECRRMAREYGTDKFAGLDLFGWRP